MFWRSTKRRKEEEIITHYKEKIKHRSLWTLDTQTSETSWLASAEASRCYCYQHCEASRPKCMFIPLKSSLLEDELLTKTYISPRSLGVFPYLLLHQCCLSFSSTPISDTSSRSIRSFTRRFPRIHCAMFVTFFWSASNSETHNVMRSYTISTRSWE
jgi:hypothetical protein